MAQPCDCGRNAGGWCNCSASDNRGGCLTYFITGRVGNCVMLPFWQAIGRFLSDLLK